jgi:hypothetical protein
MRLVLRLLLLTSVLAAAAATLAACGSDSKTSDAPAAGGPSSGQSNEQDSARVKLVQCLRDLGIDVPDTPGHNFFAQLTPVERQQAEDALNGPCRKYRSNAFGEASDPQSQEFLDVLTGFTVCLRKNGADVPDPDPTEPFAVLHSLDQTDPTIARAIAACQDKLAALNGGQ